MPGPRTCSGRSSTPSRAPNCSFPARSWDCWPTSGFEISPDGTTATVTVSIDKDISTNGSKYNEYKIGTAKITQQTKIDLTKPMPEVVDVTFSQTYVPGQIRHNPNIESAV